MQQGSLHRVPLFRQVQRAPMWPQEVFFSQAQVQAVRNSFSRALHKVCRRTNPRCGAGAHGWRRNRAPLGGGTLGSTHTASTRESTVGGTRPRRATGGDVSAKAWKPTHLDIWGMSRNFLGYLVTDGRQERSTQGRLQVDEKGCTTLCNACQVRWTPHPREAQG